eukprot:scaffold154583_cov20-Tisochrysis_lutea.AAC.1
MSECKQASTTAACQAPGHPPQLLLRGAQPCCCGNTAAVFLSDSHVAKGSLRGAFECCPSPFELFAAFTPLHPSPLNPTVRMKHPGQGLQKEAL